ncbi:MAG: helix-turn-helix transcriptional regulator [Lentisphaeria bacterium]
MTDAYRLAMQSRPDVRAVGRQFLASLMERLRAQPERLRLPPADGTGRLRRGMHMHLLPELFLQIGGQTVFRCPGDTFTLDAGEICLMPRAVGHDEQALPAAGQAFVNAVLMIAPGQLSLHLAHSDDRHRPLVHAGPVAIPWPEETPAVAPLLDEVARCYLAGGPDAAATGGAILLAVLAMVRARLADSAPDGAGAARPGRTEQCKALVRAQLGDATLSVRRLAEAVGCSADYLSTQFHRDTGLRLAEYINHQRISHARQLLSATGLNVSEVAWACGYRDPGYFIRQFRRHEGVPPLAWRHRPG